MNSTSSNDAILEQFQFYYIPILVVVGVLGNIFTIFVLYKTKLRKLSSSYYLIVLSVSDTIFLLALFVVWLKLLGCDWFNKPGFCQIIIYVSGVCSFLSVWLVLTFTFERFVAVKYPFLRQSLCTTERAKSTICILVLGSIVLFVPLILFSKVLLVGGQEVCTVNPDLQHLANVFNYLDFFITYLIPLSVIVYLNITIGRTILNLASVRKILTNHQTSRKSRKSRKSFRNRFSQSKLTKMLLIVSTVFLCLSFPSYVMRLLAYFIELNIIEINNVELFQTTQHWCLQLFYTNFGINFYLYCITGQNFRKTLFGLFQQRRLKRGETAALTESRTLSTSSSMASRRRRTMSVYVEHQEAKTIRKQLNILTEET